MKPSVVKYLCLTFEKEYDSVHPKDPLKRDKVWYKRVLRWCKDQKISLRVMNKVTPTDKSLQASRVEGTSVFRTNTGGYSCGGGEGDTRAASAVVGVRQP